MGFSVERNGYTDIKTMGAQILSDLKNNGFEVLAVDRRQSDNVGVDKSEYIITPTLAVDPLCSDDQQPWRWMFEFNSGGGYINMWVLTPQQITSGYEPSSYGDNKDSGRLSPGNTNIKTGGLHYFYSNGSQTPYWSCYAGDSVDVESAPLSYQLSISDHGVFLATWAESYNSSGDCFNWVVIQRPVDCNTGLIIVDGKAPLLCMFSQSGNSSSSNLDNVDAIKNKILHFVVRENDINAPTPPISSCVPTADSYPLINPIQQVALMEDGSFVLRFPQGFTTARHMYDHKLDMIAYTSADVISSDSEPRFNVFGETIQRTYKALHANFPDNTGMRLLCQIAGKGIDS